RTNIRRAPGSRVIVAAAGMVQSSPGVRGSEHARLVQLDLLRCLAIVLVLGRHMVPCPSHTNAWLGRLTSIWHRGGWIGVDLFFVLSGFLVSGLLFREYQRHAFHCKGLDSC